VKALHGNLGCIPRGACDVLKPGGAGDVDPAMDRMNPSGAGERDDNASRSKYRKAADDAKPLIERFLSQRFAAGDGDLDEHVVQVCAKAFGSLADGKPDHPARHWIDGWLAGRNSKTRLGHHADPLAGAVNNPRARLASADSRFDKRAVRDVRIVSCVLDDASRGAGSIGFADRYGEGRSSAAGKLDLRYRGAFARDERLAGGAHSGGGTSPGRPASPQRRTLFVPGFGLAAAHRSSNRRRRHPGQAKREPGSQKARAFDILRSRIGLAPFRDDAPRKIFEMTLFPKTCQSFREIRAADR
jgi:hypothetical protein